MTLSYYRFKSGVERDCKLKSRTVLIGEHPNPLYLVQHKDTMIQHRKMFT